MLMPITSYNCEEGHMLLLLRLKEQLKPDSCHLLDVALCHLHSVHCSFAGI
jgi:hypothetical protein